MEIRAFPDALYFGVREGQQVNVYFLSLWPQIVAIGLSVHVQKVNTRILIPVESSKPGLRFPGTDRRANTIAGNTGPFYRNQDRRNPKGRQLCLSFSFFSLLWIQVATKSFADPLTLLYVPEVDASLQSLILCHS